MRNFFDWFKTTGQPLLGSPWLIFGKGPTFSKHLEYRDLDERYHTLGLNHICRERRVYMTHIIDANVLDEVKHLEEKTDYLVMPWHPHFEFRATKTTLEDLAFKDETLWDLDEEGRLLWYDLSTGTPREPEGKRSVKVSYYSIEAALRLLAMSGIRTIRTLGVDGGTDYAKEFSDIRPLRGGNATFSLQDEPVKKIVQEFNLDYKPLWETNL